MLRPFEKQIINYKIKKLKIKNICFKFIKYQSKFEMISRHYPKNSLIIEGHFHQGVIYKNYISLPSLACQGRVGVIVDGKVLFKSFK